jgi:membrane-bound ClpP family serine protease
MMTAVSDPVLERRIRIAKLVKAGKRVGYSLFLLAMILFFIGVAASFSSALTNLIVAALVIGSLVLAPAIVMGYAVRSAHREDHEMGRL